MPIEPKVIDGVERRNVSLYEADAKSLHQWARPYRIAFSTVVMQAVHKLTEWLIHKGYGDRTKKATLFLVEIDGSKIQSPKDLAKQMRQIHQDIFGYYFEQVDEVPMSDDDVLFLDECD